MRPVAEHRLFLGQFLLLFAFSLSVTFWISFKTPPPAFNGQVPEEKAYLFQDARVLFSDNLRMTASEVLSRKNSSQAVSLPNFWDDIRPGFEGQAWYLIDFQLDPAKPVPDALFMPKAIMNAHAYLNGQWVGGLGQLEGDLTRHWNHPYLFQFPPQLLKAGENTLMIQVAGYKNYRSGLGRLWLGPSELLEPVYDTTYRWQVTGSMLATLVAFGSGLLLLLFSRLFHEQQGFLFLSLAVMAFAIRNTGYFLDWTPLPHAQWGQLIQTLHAWFAAFYCLFLIRYIGLQWAWPNWVFPGYATFITVFTVVANGAGMQHFTLAMLTPILPVTFLLNVLVLRHAWIKRNFEAALLGWSSMLFVVLSLRDLATLTRLVPVESILVSQYTGLLFFVVGSWIILRRYQALLKQLQTSNQSLNSELAIREQQLVKQFNLLRKIEQQRVQDEERRRIMQDIHDGVGSSLVSALNLGETRTLGQDEMRNVLQECLDDLRMAIDSLDPQSNDLLALLGNFRWRYERRLKASGVTLDWQVEDVPPLEGYSSRDLFDLLRIVQEVFANSLKHARASRIELAVRWDAEHQKMLLTISDNGVGLPANLLGRGRGLSHMKIRAKSIQVDFHLGAGPQGKGVTAFIEIPKSRRK